MTMIDRDELLKKIDPMSLSNGSVLGRHSGTADVIAGRFSTLSRKPTSP